MSRTREPFRDRDGCPIKILTSRDPRQLKDRRGQINMRRHRILDPAFRNPRTPNEKRHAYILFKTTGLSGRQPVLTNMEPIVGGVDDISIIQFLTLFDARYERIHQLVHALQGAETRAVEVVVVIHDRLILLRQIPDPTHATGLVGIEVLVPGDFDILEEMLVSLEWDRGGHDGDFSSQCSSWIHVGMRSDGGDGEEEGSFTLESIIEEAECLFCDHVGCVVALVTYGGILVALIGGVEVGVGVGVEEEVGTIETIDVRAMVIVDCVCIEEFAGVVGVITGLLQPDGEEVVVEAPVDKLGISAYKLSIYHVRYMPKNCPCCP